MSNPHPTPYAIRYCPRCGATATFQDNIYEEALLAAAKLSIDALKKKALLKKAPQELG